MSDKKLIHTLIKTSLVHSTITHTNNVRLEFIEPNYHTDKKDKIMRFEEIGIIVEHKLDEGVLMFKTIIEFIGLLQKNGYFITRYETDEENGGNKGD